MQSHHFTLIVEGPDMQDEAMIDALFKNGCDDGTVGRSDGVQFIVFDREGASFTEAVQSAIDDIQRTPGLRAVRIAGDDARQAANLVQKGMHSDSAKNTRHLHTNVKG